MGDSLFGTALVKTPGADFDVVVVPIVDEWNEVDEVSVIAGQPIEEFPVTETVESFSEYW